MVNEYNVVHKERRSNGTVFDPSIVPESRDSCYLVFNMVNSTVVVRPGRYEKILILNRSFEACTEGHRDIARGCIADIINPMMPILAIVSTSR